MAWARPSELELQVLSLLWQRGPSTAREVLGAMPDGKGRAYTTILSVLQVMAKKRLVTHSTRGVTHVYRPTVTRSQVLGPMLRSMVANVFGGSPAAAMQHLLAETTVSEEDLAEIRRMLEGRGLGGQKGEEDGA